MVEIIGLAHAAIFTQHRLLIDRGRDDERGRALLDESVQIVFTDTPSAPQGTIVGERWGEQQLLDPGAAEETQALLGAELEEAERRLGALAGPARGNHGRDEPTGGRGQDG